ncbi:hypothetical protein ACFVQ4_34160 [Streptomyces laurentii]|uniref:hypothetical protein n=1 Tax=Streptomyces laurentii TaxID=39478 RepID=UPI0036C81758
MESTQPGPVGLKRVPERDVLPGAVRYLAEVDADLAALEGPGHGGGDAGAVRW